MTLWEFVKHVPADLMQAICSPNKGEPGHEPLLKWVKRDWALYQKSKKGQS